MTITTTLSRWSRASNLRRSVELVVLAAPWLVAAVAGTVAAGQVAGTLGAGIVATLAAAALVVAGVRHLKKTWHDPRSFALAVDRAHGTSDLLASAAALEAARRTPGAVEPPLAAVVLARAADAVDSLAPRAVPPLRLRIGASSALAAAVAVALVFVLGATGRRFRAAEADEARKHDPAAAVLDEEELRKAAEAAHAIASDRKAPAEARDEAAKAAAALARAKTAASAAAALGELSEAQRALERAAKALGARKAPNPAELAKLDDKSLAEQLAEAAKRGDSEKLAALAREALRRATADPANAAQLAEQLAQAAAHQKAGGKGGADAERRLNKLTEAASRMAAGDSAGARDQLSALDKLSKSGAQPADPQSEQVARAQAALAQMRAAQRDALNRGADARAQAAQAAMQPGAPRPGGMSEQDAQAQAARAQAAGPGKDGGSGMGSGMGRGKPGAGQNPGGGEMPGAGQIAAGGAPPGGMPSSGQAKGRSETGPDGAVSVRTGSGSSGHGATGPKSPSGAGAPSAFSAEQVETGPAVTPEGAVRAIAERAAGVHQPTAFDPIRKHYEAIAEAAIRKDDIPLTRRDYIQRYFAALRTREEP
jgi:hypothetical protein